MTKKELKGILFERLTNVPLYTEPVNGMVIAEEMGLTEELEQFNDTWKLIEMTTAPTIDIYQENLEKMLQEVVGDRKDMS